MNQLQENQLQEGTALQHLNIGLIGYGFAGATFHAPLIGAVPGLALAHVASSRPDVVHAALPKARVHADPQALIDTPDVDVVVIATPNESHHPLARRALLAGKHVVVDKPFTLTVAEAEDLAQLARARGRLLSVFHNRRWDNDFLTVRQQIESGVLGEINTFISTLDRYRPAVRVRWREDGAVPGAGTLFDLGPHLIDQALLLFGMPRRVLADLGAQRTGASATDYFHLVLGYDGGLRVILHAGSVVRLPGPRFAVHGRLGSLVKHGFDPQEDALRAGRTPGDGDWGLDAESAYAELVLDRDGAPVSTRAPTLAGAHHAYYRGLREAIVHGAPSPVTAEDGVAVMRVIEAAQRSAAEARMIPIE
jgi:scyllo-inositol 2-dehydrogenase (NADP+)